MPAAVPERLLHAARRRHADRAPAGARPQRDAGATDGVRIDPRDWNRADGFSPGQQITVRIPGLDTQRAFDRTGLAPITDIGQSLAQAPPGRADRRADRQAPAVLGGARQLGAGREARAADPAGAQPPRGPPLRRRAARSCKTACGRAIAPTFGFRALRDRRATGSKAINAPARLDAQGLPPAAARRRRAREPRPRLGLHGRQPALDDRADAAHARPGLRGARRPRPGRSEAGGPLARVRDHGRHADARRPGDRADRRRHGQRPVLPAERRLRGRRRLQPRRGRPAGAEARQHLRGARSAASIPRDVPAGGGRALLYGHGLLGSPLDSRDSAQAQLKTLAAPAGLHRLRHLLERALGRQRRRGHRPGRCGDPGPLEVRRDHRPAPAGHAQHALPRPRDGGRGRVPRAARVRRRVRRVAAAVLRRQLAGRDRGRRAHRDRAGLRPRGARRASA